MPTYSEVTITFGDDFLEDSTLKMTHTIGGINTDETWTWVLSRSSGFEVTTGTPTVTLGETSAINFESAFLLDHPTDFILTRTGNEILIQSEVLGYDFYGFKAVYFTTNIPTFSVVFNNYIIPIDNSNIDFALVRSPHYVNVPFLFDTTTSVTLDLYVWDGDLTVVPATPTYTLTFPRPATNYEEFNIDLSKLIQEQIDATITIDLTSTTQVVDSTDDSVKWVKYVASYTDPDEIISDIEGTFTGLDGYGLYSQGVNPTKPTDNILTEATIRKVSRDGFILFPFINNSVITSIDIDSTLGSIDETETITVSDESTDIVQYIEVDVSQTTTDEYITITTLPANDVITYEIIDECRYNPIQLVFKNRLGVYDCLTLFKKNNVSTSTNNDTFVNNYVTSGAYDTTKHQFQKLNITAKKTIKVNSGYISEIENTLYEQLLYSDKVWFYENSLLVPVNVKNSSLEFKNRVNDKLVNYSMEFEYAYSEIQNV